MERNEKDSTNKNDNEMYNKTHRFYGLWTHKPSRLQGRCKRFNYNLWSQVFNIVLVVK